MADPNGSHGENRIGPLPLFEEFSGSNDRRVREALVGSTPSAVSIVVLGPPGSGKGTQAALLSERFRLPHVSTGDMLRDRILVGDAFGKQIAERIDFGQFVPDCWITRLLDERLQMQDCRFGVILDGYPRTLSQAELFWDRAETFGQRVIVARLCTTKETLLRRFHGRRQCSKCGSLFHLRYQPSLAGDACDRPGCAGQLEERPDDRPEFLARRLSDFEELTAPVVAFLETRAAGFVSVDAGEGSPEDILERIVDRILPWMRGES